MEMDSCNYKYVYFQKVSYICSRWTLILGVKLRTTYRHCSSFPNSLGFYLFFLEVRIRKRKTIVAKLFILSAFLKLSFQIPETFVTSSFA